MITQQLSSLILRLYYFYCTAVQVERTIVQPVPPPILIPLIQKMDGFDANRLSYHPCSCYL
jgi:hypothetical protein